MMETNSTLQTLSYTRSLTQAGWEFERNAANSIVNMMRHLRLPLDLDELTRGMGDCMVIALLQQVRRPQVCCFLPQEIKSLASEKTVTVDSMNVFRLTIWDFARTSEDPQVRLIKENFESLHSLTWASHWEKLIKQGEWGDQIFLQCTALYLRLNILIFSTSSSEENPLTQITGTDDGTRPDLILGYTGNHYQSLLPSDPSQLRLQSPASSPQKSPSKTVSNTAGVVGAFFSPGSSPAKLTDAERKKQAARERQKKSRAKRKAESSGQSQPKAKLSDAEKKERNRQYQAAFKAKKRAADLEKFKSVQNSQKAESREGQREADPEKYKSTENMQKEKTRARQREADPEKYKSTENIQKAKNRAGQREADLTKFQSLQNENTSQYQARQREADPVGFKERQNKRKDNSRTNQRDEDYVKHKTNQNQRKAKSRAQRKKKFGSGDPEPGLPVAKQKKEETSEDRSNSFKLATMVGADYICVSCHIKHFRPSVVRLTDELEAEIDDKMLPETPWIADRNLLTKVSVEWSKNLRVPVDYKNSDSYCGQRFICKTCLSHLQKKNLPPSSVMNGLQLHESDQQLTEQNLMLTPLEANLVAPRIIFQMVQLLPRSRWTNFKNQNIMVPIPADKINDTLSQMPRIPVEGGLLAVNLKRKKDYSGSHAKCYVNPDKMFRFVKKMIEKKNPFFSQVVCDSSPEDYEARVLANDKRGHNLIYDADDIEEDLDSLLLPSGDGKLLDDILPDEVQQQTEDEKEKQEDLIDEEEWKEEQDYVKNDAVKKFQFPGYDATSCLIDNFPEVSVAPGEGQKPINMRTDKDWDVQAFPHLHNPDGSCGMDQVRSVRLTNQRYFIQRILNKELRFSRSAAYLYAAVGYLEQQRISGNISLSGRRGQRIQSGGNISYQLDDATRVLEKIKNTPAYWRTMKYELLAKLDNLGPFHIFFTLSCADSRWPTNFASILADRGHEINHKCESVDGVLTITIEVRTKAGDWVPMDVFIKDHLDITKHELVRQNVLSATRFFDQRVKQFLRKIVLSKSNPMTVHHYSYKVEFQARGAAHIHGVLWLDLKSIERQIPQGDRNEFANRLQTVFGKLRHDEDLSKSDIECLVDFIDNFVTVCTHAPTVGEDVARIALEVQKHHHTRTCRKLGTVCRFNYPKPPSPFTILQIPVKDTPEDRQEFCKHQSNIKAVLDESQKDGVVQDIMNDFSKATETPGDDYREKRIERIKALCARANVSYEAYLEALKHSMRGYTYVLARDIDETNINPFNPEWLRSWDANMDVQPVLDFFQVITYITNYYSKADSGVTRNIMAALKDKDCADVKEAFKLVASIYTKSREINECEAAYRLIPSLFLSSSSIKCKFAVTGLKEKRSTMFRLATEKHLDMGIECIELEGREGLWYEQPDQWSKYLRRPDILRDICFAQFVKMYDSASSGKSMDESNEDVDNENVQEDDPDHEDVPVTSELDEQIDEVLTIQDEEFNKWHHVMTYKNNGERGLELPLLIKLKNPIPGESQMMRRRQQPACLRFHKVREDKDAKVYMLNELMLYSPLTDELDIDSVYDLYNQEYKGKKKVDIVKNQVMEYLQSVEEARIMVAEAEAEIDEFMSEVAAALDPQGEQENDECEFEGLEEHPDFLHLDPEVIEKETNQTASTPFIRIEVPPSDELYQKIASLDKFQSEVVNIAHKYARDLVKTRKSGNCPPVAPLLMVHGGAGAGKSTVINLVAQLVTQTLTKEGDDLDQPYVLKAAFTGTAASNIGGNTLNSMFSLKFSNNSGSYTAMSTKKLDQRRVELSNLKLLIIDEVSMLKADMLYEIDARLQEITMKTHQPFGGVAVMCFGDMMQLKPVGGRWIFQPPKNATQFCPLFAADPRWTKFSCVILEKNHRQGRDMEYANVLNRIRVGEHTQADCDLLRSRIRPPNDPVLKNADLHIGCKRQYVSNSNAKYIQSLPGELIVLKAGHSQSNQKKFKPRVDKVSGVVGNTSFLERIDIKLSAKVILIHNLDTSDCLTNGQLGQLIDVIRTPSGDEIDRLVVKFNNRIVGKNWRQQNPALAAKYPDCVVLSRVLFPYTLTKRGTEGATAKVYQFPLWVADAITAHKIQGQTVPYPQTVVINLLDMLPSPAALAYVMLSRVQCLDQIYFEGGINEEKIVMDHSALTETLRLKEISWNSNPGPWMNQDSQALKVASMNVASLRGHIDFMRTDDRLQMADVLHLQETWIDPNDDRDTTISPRYQSCFVNVGRGKGVASYYTTRDSETSNVHRNDNFQVLKLTVRGVDLINVYRSQAGKTTELINVLTGMIDDVKPTLISGDFNICTMDKPENIVTRNLEQMGFVLVIREATHILGGHIDQVYWRDPEGLWDVPVIERYSPYYSDHDAVLVTLDRL